MRKIPLPDENRRRAERLTDGEGEKSIQRGRKIREKSSGGGFAERKAFTTEGDEADGKISGAEFYDGCFTDGDFSETEVCEELIKKGAKKSAREYALLLVSAHTYTENALFRKIKSKRIYSDEDISDAVEHVKGFGYVNDKRLAENSVPRLAERCYGKSKICRYLSSKGISEEVIESLDFSEIDFVYYCKRLLDKYAGRPDEKVMRALLNAGYTYGEIAAAKKIRD